MTFDLIIKAIDDFVWGIPLIVLILGVGIYLTVRLLFLPIRKLGRAFKYMFEKEEGAGEVSSFGALCTALSATIGTGNIVGVATAIVAGGPGALFWMWLAAFFGMATKYAEGLLAVKYRKVYPDGHTLGGPFYYIENGLGKRWKFLAVIFAVLGMCVGLFGIGTFSQVNSITGAVNNVFDGAPTVTLFGGEYSIAVVIGGLLVAAAVALVRGDDVAHGRASGEGHEHRGARDGLGGELGRDGVVEGAIQRARGYVEHDARVGHGCRIPRSSRPLTDPHCTRLARGHVPPTLA